MSDLSEKILGQMTRLDHAEKSLMRVEAGGDHASLQLIAVGEHDSRRAALLDQDFRDRRLSANLDVGLAGRVRNGVRDGAGAAARESPGAEGAVNLAHVVVQQHVGGAGRAYAEKGADNARGGHRRLEHIGLEPLVEKVGGAHGHELHQVVLVAGGQGTEMARQEGQLAQIAGSQPRGIGRSHGQNWLDELRHAHHRLAVFFVRLGVDARMARDLAPRLPVVVDAPEIVAVEWRERAIQRKYFETVARQVELADDLGPKQGDDIGADGKLEAGKHLFGDRRAAQHVPALEHQNLLPGARQIRGVDQTVVSATDDDRVVRGAHEISLLEPRKGNTSSLPK